MKKTMIQSKKNKKEAILIYPHQLFEKNDLLKKDREIFLIEDPLFFTQYKFHQQKILLHRASMKFYKEFLEQKGYEVNYIESKQIKKSEEISNFLKNIDIVYFYDFVDDWLTKKVTKSLEKLKIKFIVTETPLFLTKQSELDEYFLPKIKNEKSLLMNSFYQWQRKRMNILVDKNLKPKGGKWSFDAENRKKLPKEVSVPESPKQNKNKYVLEAKKYVDKNFGDHYGNSDYFIYPTTHSEARAWFKNFLELKFKNFGPYEDAITERTPFVFHSVLTPALNIGLITPDYIVQQTLKFAEKNSVPIESLEGFIRQIIGWREYIRAVYIYLGSKSRNSNYFKANRKIPENFWRGDTGIYPIDNTIKTALEYAYSHHISRLMIMGNFMNLCQFKPNEIYKWFMEMYIDAYDWVMVPNVYSMTLYADGGLITTKPYISGSSYVLRMTDYKKGDWTEIWDALFWNFINVHYKELKSENRLFFIIKNYEKIPKEKINHYKKTVVDFLKKLN